MRTFRDIFNDLEEISKKDIFLETVTYLSHINLNCSADEIDKRNFKILLNENSQKNIKASALSYEALMLFNGFVML